MQTYFHNFIEKISIDEIKLGSQITTWKECLEGKLAIEFVRRSGSTKRGTSLNSSDVDLIVVFDKGKVDTSIPVEFFATTEGDIRNCFGKIKRMDHGFIYEDMSGGSIDIKVSSAKYCFTRNDTTFYRLIKEPHFADIKIIDSGPGIPDEAMEHLFEPFYSTKERGTGLGLCISQRIIPASSGTITQDGIKRILCPYDSVC